MCQSTSKSGLGPTAGSGGEPIHCCFRSRTLHSRVLMGGGIWGVWDWGYWGSSRGYLLEADGQQLSHKVGPFAHRDGSSCKPVWRQVKEARHTLHIPWEFSRSTLASWASAYS